MSERNGDRARFQKERKRKLRRRQRIQELVKTSRQQTVTVGNHDNATGENNAGAKP